jgi:hypothetical protein
MEYHKWPWTWTDALDKWPNLRKMDMRFGMWNTWPDNKVRELIVVKVLHTSLLNIPVVSFKVLPLGSYALMPVPSPAHPSKLFWN